MHQGKAARPEFELNHTPSGLTEASISSTKCLRPSQSPESNSKPIKRAFLVAKHPAQTHRNWTLAAHTPTPLITKPIEITILNEICQFDWSKYRLLASYSALDSALLVSAPCIKQKFQWWLLLHSTVKAPKEFSNPSGEMHRTYICPYPISYHGQNKLPYSSTPSSFLEAEGYVCLCFCIHPCDNRSICVAQGKLNQVNKQTSGLLAWRNFSFLVKSAACLLGGPLQKLMMLSILCTRPNRDTAFPEDECHDYSYLQFCQSVSHLVAGTDPLEVTDGVSVGFLREQHPPPQPNPALLIAAWKPLSSKMLLSWMKYYWAPSMTDPP